MNESKQNNKTGTVSAVEWHEDNVLMLDQRILPGEEQYIVLKTSGEVASAITDMVVRGAPAIGIAAAYGVVLAAREAFAKDVGHWRVAIEPLLHRLADARPTAVNLHWAIKRMKHRFAPIDGDPETVLLREARTIHEEDIAANYRIGELGADFIDDAKAVMTHCNAGALATGGYGTALGVIRSAYREHHVSHIYACETRPWLQGARLTVWELIQDNIPATLISDGAAASIMQAGDIDCVIVGADRIAANGDVVNKIGTYSHALAARYHGVKFMVAAPTSTIDLHTASGKEIPIEERDANEFYGFTRQIIVPEKTKIYNPVFDITPAELVDVMVTEKGLIEQPDREKIRVLMET